MRRGVVPPDFGKPVPFNPAFPIYGGKTMKTNIVNNCDCPIDNSSNQDIKIYNNPLWQPYPSGNLSFNVGDYVYAIQTGTDYYARAIVTAKSESDIYTIKFDNGVIQTSTINELRIYFPCNCGASYNDSISFPSGIFTSRSSPLGLDCVILKSKLIV